MPSASRPFVLNTGRLRDQWHTMTRTGGVPRLAAHAPEPRLALNAADAARLKIEPNGLVQIESDYGAAIARAALDDGMPPGMVFLPMHWNDQFTADCVAGKLVNPYTDELSGQPELKHTPVSLKPVPACWEGFLLTRESIQAPRDHYWARRAVEGGFLYELAGAEVISSDFLPREPDDEILDYRDIRRGALRLAALRKGVLMHCLFVGPAGTLPARDGLVALFADGAPLAEDARSRLLSGCVASDAVAPGRTVCACFNVGLNAILEAIRLQAAGDVRQIGRLVKAGTNCGSCVPELKEILRQERRLAAE